jgi:hypothetical protein
MSNPWQVRAAGAEPFPTPSRLAALVQTRFFENRES